MKIPYKKLVYILFISFSLLHAAYGKICSPADAEVADTMVDKLNSWTEVDRTFKLFKQCDDGSIAEGNSEAIARLLVDKWDTLPVLAKLIKRNPPLKLFVLNHINTTLDTNDLEKIKQLSTSACPERLDSLCVDLKKAATDAI